MRSCRRWVNAWSDIVSAAGSRVISLGGMVTSKLYRFIVHVIVAGALCLCIFVVRHWRMFIASS